MKKIIVFLFIVLISLGFTSCKKKRIIEDPGEGGEVEPPKEENLKFVFSFKDGVSEVKIKSIEDDKEYSLKEEDIDAFVTELEGVTFEEVKKDEGVDIGDVVFELRLDEVTINIHEGYIVYLDETYKIIEDIEFVYDVYSNYKNIESSGWLPYI